MKFENIYKDTEENLRLALLSLWTPGNHPMRPAIEDLFKREPLLAEPVFQGTFGWEPTPQSDDSWRKTINQTVWEKIEGKRKKNEGKAFRPFIPFKHQAESWKSLADGKSIVVTSGTGSGKTECFMYPVLSDLFEQEKYNKPRAIEAIFLYPLNALMEDQKTRLSSFCEATGLHFAVYNGNTPEYPKDGDPHPNERGSRDQIRNEDTRPQILLTNPSMLEYILVRDKDQQMIKESAGKLRWIVIDEVHSYSGSAAVELAYQIKRILNAFGETPEQVRFACTSATVGGKAGEESLVKFISTITGLSKDKIKVIGGNRLVPSLDDDKSRLESALQEQHLPSADSVLSLRKKINEVPCMTLRQIWERLRPGSEFEILPALRLLDDLCEMEFDGVPVLSLRAHYFMRTISGLYACANEECSDANKAVPVYGHLTTYKASVCPSCGAPLLEIVQCKRCGGFELMGCETRMEGATDKMIISPCEDTFERDDYFSIDTDDSQEEESTQQLNTNTFFLMPYRKDKFCNPVSGAHESTFNISYDSKNGTTTLDFCDDGKWVDVRKADRKSYCPDCGRLAQGKRLNFKHFRIPISFVNQTISPVLLHECATNGRTWGKYIAFTDSRQGTAISAKTFNIDVERTISRERVIGELAQPPKSGIDLSTFSPELRDMMLAELQQQPKSLSLKDVADCIYDNKLFEHIAYNEKNNEDYYKAAILRQYICRKSLYEKGMENMGLIKLVYPAIQDIGLPNSVIDYNNKYNTEINQSDWHDFLKIALDYFFRVGNHIQPISDGEDKYVRDGSRGVPVVAPNAQRNNERCGKWPTINIGQKGEIRPKQNRLVLLLCAGLGINTLEELKKRNRFVNDILQEAWTNLVDNRILKRVNEDDDNNYRDYIGCYYLDLSANSEVCKIERTTEVKICPVTGNMLDTTFRGYSPFITGEIGKNLFERYKCSDETIKMPQRPESDDNVDEWLQNNEEVKNLKEKGLWSDRYKYTYKWLSVYIAAEHSAQQSKKLLEDYTGKFKEGDINVLHCSTTMEMGVDIGDIDVVLMDTIPPTAANYQQRVGRAGRKGQRKAIAFSLCNNTPVGMYAFANPTWAMQSNSPKPPRKSDTIIQRHINSFCFREFICGVGGIKTTITIGEFMDSACSQFIEFLDKMSTSAEEQQVFKKVFGDDDYNTKIVLTKQSIEKIQEDYNRDIEDLRDAWKAAEGKEKRRMAISNQIDKIESEKLLHYLSGHQFIPNANMPTGVLTFDFISAADSDELYSLYKKRKRLIEQIRTETDDIRKDLLNQKLEEINEEIDKILKRTTASRDMRTALNEYAPEQTVVVNEKNYVSAGIVFRGAYNQETQTKYIYQCRNCGNTEYIPTWHAQHECPVCGTPCRGILTDNSSYTWAYEPVGFSTDQNKNPTRTEKTEKRFYDIRPVLLSTNWVNSVRMNMCDISSSGENGKILYCNCGIGYGFAFCKHCGRAVVERQLQQDNNVPAALDTSRDKHHQSLLKCTCDAVKENIARNVVFVGNLPTCYSVLRFYTDNGSSQYEKDEELAYSLGVVLKRALAKFAGIDETEIDFGIKKERDDVALFIYDTAKGGCGYSLMLSDPGLCKDIFNLAKEALENADCQCEKGSGACAHCLIDRNNYMRAKLLSKAKALGWLKKQTNKAFEVTDEIRRVSPSAQPEYCSLKDIVRRAINNPEVEKLSLFVSDSTDCTITEWSDIHSEMGTHINNAAVTKRKQVELFVEYHPEYHRSLPDKLPFITLKERFANCTVRFIKDMGPVKTAMIVDYRDNKRCRYIVDDATALSFSNSWGEGEDCHIFVDNQNTEVFEQDPPVYEEPLPSQIIKEGFTDVTSFPIRNYFTEVICPLLQPQDTDMIREILQNRRVNIRFSDKYVNSALASLMLVYMIKEIKDIYNLNIARVVLQLDSQKRQCDNDRFNDWTKIHFNFDTTENADKYTESLFEDILNVHPVNSPADAGHHRWLRFETDKGMVEIRPDHGISGGYTSDSTYMNLDRLDGSVKARRRNNEAILYYVIIDKNNA